MQVDVKCGRWTPPRSGTGVILGERHVLTAAHVVGCPTLPTVWVTYIDGPHPRRARVVVTREDRLADLARLELASADRFPRDIHPPLLRRAAPAEGVCATLALPDHPARTCGVIADEDTVAREMVTEPGDSGAPIYCRRGTLVGLVIRSGESTYGRPYTRVAPIDPAWIADLVPPLPPADTRVTQR